MTSPGASTKTRMQALLEMGQSVWLDYLRRGMTRSGELQAMIERGLRGMTSNPTIFEHAIGGSNDYDEDLAKFKLSQPDIQVFETLAMDDVREAADVFRPTYDESAGTDGFVSIEVSPAQARDTQGTIAEARRLWAEVDRPNVMIKVPGTREGWPAVERLLTDGINVNITLLFSLEHYGKVAEAYLKALETRSKAGRPIDRIASVASFFVSRVDTEVDKRLQKRTGGSAFAGKAAVANAHLAYAKFLEMSRTARWKALEKRGARPQRLLWASTGTRIPPTRTRCTSTCSSARRPSTRCLRERWPNSKIMDTCRRPCHRWGSRPGRHSTPFRLLAWTWPTWPGSSRTTASRNSPTPSPPC